METIQVCLNVKEESGMEIGMRDSNAALGRRTIERDALLTVIAALILDRSFRI